MRGQWLILTLGACVCGAFACEDKFQAPESGPASAGAGGEEQPTAGSANAGGVSGQAGERTAQAGAEDGSGGETAAGSGGDFSAGGEGGAVSGEPMTCRRMADCEAGENCVTGRCVAPLISCAAQKNSHPASKDGVYWIGTAGALQRAYCDMQLSAELCTEVAGEHHGRTRGKAAIGYTMTSVLLLSEGVCKMWAIRGSDDGYPFDQLKAVAGVPEGQTCISLGFAGDGVLGACKYGSERTSCGFEVTPLYWYGNNCAGCVKNDGVYDRWTLQGPAIQAATLSSTSGTEFTTCKVGR